MLDADPAAVFADIAPVLRRANAAIGNLETAVTTRGSPEPKQYVFRAPATAFTALRDAGFTVVSMANNHGMDFGPQGLQDSITAAQSANFPVIGIGENAAQAYQPFMITINGERVAFLAATQVLDADLQKSWSASEGKPGIASAKPGSLDRLFHAVRLARQHADTVIVYLHWGTELVPCPTESQQMLAKALVAAGADIVVGSHAHILLGRGFLGHAFIDYGLGNFLFYARSTITKQTGVLTLTVQGRKVLDATWTPAVIIDGIPHLRTGGAAATALYEADRLRECTNLTAQPG